jgi:hypothetical protein
MGPVMDAQFPKKVGGLCAGRRHKLFIINSLIDS